MHPDLVEIPKRALQRLPRPSGGFGRSLSTAVMCVVVFFAISTARSQSKLRSVWYDEAFTIVWMRADWEHFWQLARRDSGNGVGYVVVLRLLDWLWPGSTVLLGLLEGVSILAWVGLLVGVFACFARVGHWFWGATTAAVMTLTWIHHQYATELRPYPIGAAIIGLLLFVSLDATVVARRRVFIALVAGLLFAAPLVHPLMIPLTGYFAIFFAWRIRFRASWLILVCSATSSVCIVTLGRINPRGDSQLFWMAPGNFRVVGAQILDWFSSNGVLGFAHPVTQVGWLAALGVVLLLVWGGLGLPSFGRFGFVSEAPRLRASFRSPASLGLAGSPSSSDLLSSPGSPGSTVSTGSPGPTSSTSSTGFVGSANLTDSNGLHGLDGLPGSIRSLTYLFRRAVVPLVIEVGAVGLWSAIGPRNYMLYAYRYLYFALPLLIVSSSAGLLVLCLVARETVWKPQSHSLDLRASLSASARLMPDWIGYCLFYLLLASAIASGPGALQQSREIVRSVRSDFPPTVRSYLIQDLKVELPKVIGRLAMTAPLEGDSTIALAGEEVSFVSMLASGETGDFKLASNVALVQPFYSCRSINMVRGGLFPDLPAKFWNPLIDRSPLRSSVSKRVSAWIVLANNEFSVADPCVLSQLKNLQGPKTLLMYDRASRKFTQETRP
jgi:hypothetical protein